MSDTAIGWADEVLNPTRGCSAVSPGCGRCYAQAVAGSPFTGLSKPGRPYHDLVEIRADGQPRWTGKVVLDPSKLQNMLRRRPYRICADCGAKSPIGTDWYSCPWHAGAADGSTRWRRPRIFVNSMSDLFHEALTDEQIAAVYGVMAACPWADFLILTKRAERLPAWYRWLGRPRVTDGDGEVRVALACLYAIGVQWERHIAYPAWPLPNCWLGVSVEDQQRCTRIIDLLRVPAAVHWCSFEPLLEDVDPSDIQAQVPGGGIDYVDAVSRDPDEPLDPQLSDGAKLAWAVVGGESGSGHRTCPDGAIERLTRKLDEAGVPVFVKQDSGSRAGKQGRIPDEIWAYKQFPEVRP